MTAHRAPLRCLLVVPRLGIGGTEVQVARLARHLRDVDVAPEVAAFAESEALQDELEAAGVRVHILPRRGVVGPGALFKLGALLAAESFPVVHSFLWSANWRARIAARYARTPVVIASVRSVDHWMRFHHVCLDRLLAAWTDAIVVNARANQRYLMERCGLHESLFHVIYNGLEDGQFDVSLERRGARQRLQLPLAAPVILSVGSLRREKNHEDFLELARRVRQVYPQARFVVVGAGELQESLQRRARDLGLGEVVLWAGLQRDVRTYLRAADVFVNVSQREGCCNAILEAMALGLPVVAYAVGGNPEIVTDGVSGTLVAYGDVQGLATAVERYLRQPDLALRHGQAGRARVAREFRARHVAARVGELYRELLRRKGWTFSYER